MTALDRQEMADALQGGLVPKADSIVHPDGAAYPGIENQIVRYPYDPRQAAQMVEDLGYQRGSDGLFRDASGQPLKVEIRVTAGRDVTTKSTLAIQDYWQRIGVSTEPNIVPQQRSQDREYMATYPSFYMANQGVGDLAGGTFTRIRVNSIGLPENGFRATGNWARYNNPEYEALVDKFLVTISVPERTQVMGQIIHQLTDQLVISSLFFNPLPVMVNNRLQGVSAASEGWNAQDWFVTS
jgi:ABC-type transport system substrate-binding protein